MSHPTTQVRIFATEVDELLLRVCIRRHRDFRLSTHHLLFHTRIVNLYPQCRVQRVLFRQFLIQRSNSFLQTT